MTTTTIKRLIEQAAYKSMQSHVTYNADTGIITILFDLTRHTTPEEEALLTQTVTDMAIKSKGEATAVEVARAWEKKLDTPLRYTATCRIDVRDRRVTIAPKPDA